MNSHSRKIHEAITGAKAPRDLEWTQFVRFWEDVADSVEQESRDRVAVHVNGRRVVFRRPSDDRVPVEDISHARQLLADRPESHDDGRLLVVAIDATQARIIDFDLDAAGTRGTSRTVRDAQPNSRHLRTVERKSGREDEQELVEFFDQVADALTSAPADEPVVVLGHGQGKASAAAGLVARLGDKHAALARRVRGTGSVDLKSATDAELEAAALSVGTPG